MISHTITPEMANVALEINRATGTVFAWKFLAYKGIPTESIYAFLKNADGPEAADTVPWSSIAQAG